MNILKPKQIRKHKKPEPSPPKFVKAERIAQRYDVSPATIYRWGHEGVIPCVKIQGIIRFDWDVVTQMLEGDQ